MVDNPRERDGHKNCQFCRNNRGDARKFSLIFIAHTLDKLYAENTRINLAPFGTAALKLLSESFANVR